MSQFARMDEESQEPEEDFRAIRAQRDYAFVLSRAEGRRVIYEILLNTRYDQPLPVSDVNALYMAEGQRRIGLAIHEAIKAINPAYLEVMKDDFELEPRRPESREKS